MALAAVGLKTSIWNNNIRSVILLALYPVILAGMVWAVMALYGYGIVSGQPGGGHSNAQAVQAAILTGNSAVLQWWPSILAVVSVWFLISGFFHASMIRALSHGKPVAREDEPELYNLLENLCISRGLPVPRLEIIDTPARNAFSSGIGRKSYSITVTRGLTQTLNRAEMEAVLGHELTHIMNNDVRLIIVSVIFVGMLGFAAQLLWSQLRYGLYYRPRNSRDRDDGKILMFLFAVDMILWLGYLATMFTRFALERRREYMADAGAIELTKNPEALMRALQKISGQDQIPHVTEDIAMMCIENSRPFLGLFATHPSIDARLKIISEMTQTPVPDLPAPPEQATTTHNPWQ